MQIDTSFDFRNDSNGKDPDAYSPTLRKYHRFLWSKQLPIGERLELEDIDNDGLPEVIYAVDTGDFNDDKDYFDTEQLVIYKRQDNGDYKNIAPEIIGNEKFKTYGQTNT